MNRTAWQARERPRYLGRWSLVSALTALVLSACSGCGSDGEGSDDDGENMREGGDSRTTGGASGSRQRTTAEDFIVACLDESASECAEYLGDQAAKEAIEEEAMSACRHDANVLQTTRCSTAGVVGTCRRDVVAGDFVTPYVRMYYAPVTLESAELRCRSGEFTPASE